MESDLSSPLETGSGRRRCCIPPEKNFLCEKNWCVLVHSEWQWP